MVFKLTVLTSDYNTVEDFPQIKFFPSLVRKNTNLSLVLVLKSMHSKSMDWFLYNRDFRHERVKGTPSGRV